MKTKWLVFKRSDSGEYRKVWFIVQKDGRVTIDWVFTGKKHTVSKVDARHIWRGLYVMGFRQMFNGTMN